MKSVSFALIVLMICSSPLVINGADKIPVTKGQKIAFLGDSITAAGARPGGYCRLILHALNKQGLEVKGIFAGISGHKSNQMLARLEKDVLSKKPDWMTLSCGVNDVWHGKRGVLLEPYKKNITEIVTKAQTAGVKVVILTSTMIREDQANDLNQKLLPYNEFLRKLAEEKCCLLADLNKEMQEGLKKFPADAPKGKQLTSDGVHMNGLGNIMMATGVLKAFGLTEAQLAASEKEWKSLPNAQQIRLNLGMSLAEYEKLSAIAAKQKKSLGQMFAEILNAQKEKMLSE